MQGTTSVHAFVGPTGIGKTTTVAKLASLFRRKDNLKVLLLSYDDYRLAASEQLRIYSKIIDSPFETISRLDELPSILDKYKNIEMVLIDTAGRSPKSASMIKDLEYFKSCPVSVDVHLVLSTTDKEMQLDRTIRSFSPVGIQSLIFSKLDESWSYGEIFNMSSKWSLPLSYFAIGQKIPDDIERSSRERVVERIFGV